MRLLIRPLDRNNHVRSSFRALIFVDIFLMYRVFSNEKLPSLILCKCSDSSSSLYWIYCNKNTYMVSNALNILTFCNLQKLAGFTLAVVTLWVPYEKVGWGGCRRLLRCKPIYSLINYSIESEMKRRISL